jgi:beta propeller repeat protein
MKKILIVLLLMIAMVGTAFAQEIRITTDSANQGNPDISGDKIVYIDFRNGNNDIYMYDLGTASETPVITDPVVFQYSPKIDGDIVVWHDSNYDIYMKNLSSGIVSSVTTDPNYQQYPDIDSNIIVWDDDRSGNRDIYMYNLSNTGAGVQQITTNPSVQGYPRVSGDIIVWTDFRNSNYDVYIYNLSSSTETQITTDTSHQLSAYIYGDMIVWQDNRNGNPDIYMYDLSNPGAGEQQITTDLASQSQPAVDVNGDIIIWSDQRNGNYDIYKYDISTGIESPVTTDSGIQQAGAVDGNIIVWHDDRHGNLDIYMSEHAGGIYAFEDIIIDDNGDGTYNYTFVRNGIPVIELYNNIGLIDLTNVDFQYFLDIDKESVSVGNMNLNGTTKTITLSIAPQLCAVDNDTLIVSADLGQWDCFAQTNKITWSSTDGNECGAPGFPEYGKNTIGDDVTQYECEEVDINGTTYAKLSGFNHTATEAFFTTIEDPQGEEIPEFSETGIIAAILIVLIAGMVYIHYKKK